MNKVHTLHPVDRGNDYASPSRTRKSTMTEAEIGRYLRAAHAAGFTVYAIEFGEGTLRLQTKPSSETPSAACSAADDWLRRHG